MIIVGILIPRLGSIKDARDLLRIFDPPPLLPQSALFLYLQHGVSHFLRPPSKMRTSFMDDPLVELPYPGVRICNVARLSQFHETLELRTALV